MRSGNERRACEFQLLRYVPDAVRNEYVHIGVILREQGSSEGGRGAFYPRLAPGALPRSGCGYCVAGGDGERAAQALRRPSRMET